MMRVIFAGTPAFARESLRALLEAGTRPLAVLTQPDRPAGRGKKLSPSPVKVYAESQGLLVLQPESLGQHSVVSELGNFDADVFVVAAYGLLLPRAVLDLPKAACVNVHASLLPRWRGAAPIQASILAGDSETGISLMQMEAGLDTGPVYVKSAIPIGPDETAGELQDRLAMLGANLLVDHLQAIVSGDISAEPQQNDYASYAPKINARDAQLDFRRQAEDLRRQVRAFNPVPGAWAILNDERLKFWRAQVVELVDATPGTIVNATSSGIDIACPDACLRITELQRPGKDRVTAAEFITQFGANAAIVGQVFDTA